MNNFLKLRDELLLIQVSISNYIFYKRRVWIQFFISCVVLYFLCYLNLSTMPSSVTKQSKSGSIQVSLRTKHIDPVFWKACYPFVSKILSTTSFQLDVYQKNKTSWKSVELNPLERCNSVSIIEMLIIMLVLIITKNSLV